jgi:hypothetical protein
MTPLLSAVLCLLLHTAEVDGGLPDAGAADAGTATAPQGFDGGLPTPGTYWVIRQSSSWVSMSSAPRAGPYEPVRTEQTWRASCERLVLDREALRVGDELSFAVAGGEVRWPKVVSRYRASARAEASCRAAWPRQVVYGSLHDCAAARPSVLRRTCVDSVCSWNVEPWVLEGCEQQIASLRNLAAIAAEPTHSEAVRTLQQFEALLSRGGTMWAQPRCAPANFTARDREGMTTVRTVDASASWEATGAFEPLFGEARFTTQFTAFDGRGMSGVSMGSARILLGKDTVAIGNRVLVFDPRRCTAR